tara:strand:+ start:650 stop:2629 length:1980 start_codon:yes stop_codon:yes gene_type:complete
MDAMKYLNKSVIKAISIIFLYYSSFLNILPLSATPIDDDHAIEEIVIISTRNPRSFEQQPTRIEVLGGEEVNEKANMKPGDIRMLLNEMTGIHVQQTSATSFNSSIRIHGLSGKYTQLLRDSMPLYGGFSSGLGLLQIAPLDLNQVEIIKGSNSTLYGGGAIAGLVNLITKKPQEEPETSLLFNATSSGGQDLSIFNSSQKNNIGRTIFGSYNRSDAYDPANNGYSAIPEFERWTLNPRIFIDKNNSEFTIGFNAIKEDRIGGSMDYIEARDLDSAYFERIETDRFSTQFEYKTKNQAGNEFVIRNSVNRYRQDLGVPSHSFSGTQVSSFTEAHLLGSIEAMDWVVGLNLWTENFDENKITSPSNIDFDSRTFGAFAQGTFFFQNDWSIESGIRIDSTSDYGSFFLPRISVLYTPTERTTVRIGGGLGYMEPTPFGADAEAIHYRGILPIDTNQLVAEESMGLNADLNHRFVLNNEATLNFNLLVFYNKVNNPLRLLELSSNQFAYRQPDDYLDTQGAELGLVWRWKDFKYFFGYTHADVEEHMTTSVKTSSLMPKNRMNNVFVFERENDFRVGIEAYYYGEQELNDGTMGRDFWIYGLMMEKVYEKGFSVFLNFENFSDTRQTRFGSIVSGTKLNPVFSDIYAPLDGFVVNGGIKIKL